MKNAASPRSLADLTFREIESRISDRPVIILPLGGIEPYGDDAALGIPSLVAQTLADELSGRLDLLYAPVLNIGCSTPYGAFGGTMAVSPRTLTNILCETIRRWFSQNVRGVIVIDSLLDNKEAVEAAAQRLRLSHPDRRIAVFTLQRDERVKKFVGVSTRIKEPDRAEFLLRSLAAFIDPSLFRTDAEDRFDVDPLKLRAWRRRGRDPGIFRRLSPACTCSSHAGACDAGAPDRDFGRQLFEFILNLLEETASPFIHTNNT